MSATGHGEITRENRYENVIHNFSMQPPQFAQDSGKLRTIAQFYAAPKDGFAAHVTVQALHMDQSLSAYISTTKKQYKAYGLKIVRMTKQTISGAAAIEMEYEGTMQGRNLRFLTLAIERKDHILLMTGASLKIHMPSYEKSMWAAMRSISFHQSSK